MNRDNKISFPMLELPGGAVYTLKSIHTLAALEKFSGLYTYQMFPATTWTSGGGFTGLAAYTKDPNDKTGKRPRYTMEEFIPVWKEHIPLILPHNPAHHIKQTFKQVVGATGLTPPPIHYDRTPKEDILKGHYAGIKMNDLLGSVFISSHLIYPHQQQQYIFSHFDQSILKKDHNLEDFELDFPNEKIEAYKAVIASTAFPSIFDKYHIEETNTNHIDLGHIANYIDQIIMLQQNLKDDFKLEYIKVGSGASNAPIIPDEYSEQTWFSIATKTLITSSGAFATDAAIKSITRLLGKDNVYIFDKPIHEATKDNQPSMNLLDTSKKHIEIIDNFAQEEIEERKEELIWLADHLGEAYCQRNSIKDPTAAFNTCLTNNRPKPINDNEDTIHQCPITDSPEPKKPDQTNGLLSKLSI